MRCRHGDGAGRRYDHRARWRSGNGRRWRGRFSGDDGAIRAGTTGTINAIGAGNGIGIGHRAQRDAGSRQVNQSSFHVFRPVNVDDQHTPQVWLPALRRSFYKSAASAAISSGFSSSAKNHASALPG